LTNAVSLSSAFYAKNIIANDTFYVEGTSPQGCQSDTFVVVSIVNTQPPIIGGDIEVCEGSDVVIGYNDIGDSYQWSGSNGFNTYDSVFTLRAVTSLDTGTYTFSLVDTNGCQLPDTTLRLIVNPNPVVPIVAGINSICNGVDTIVLYTTNRTATAGSDLFWRNSPVGAPLLGDTIRIDNATGGPLYTTGVWVAIVRDSITLCTSSALPYNIQVNPIPTTTITKSGINCGGGNARFQPGLVQAGASYTWYSPDTLIAIDSNTVFTINNLTTDTTVVLEIELNGCTAYAVDSVTVSGNGVVPTLLAVPTVCEGDDVTIGTTTFGRNYEWEDPSGNFITYDSAFVLTGVSTADTGSYTLRFVDSVGCVSLPVSVVLNVNPAPPLPVILGDSTVCEGGVFNLSINLNAGDSVWWVNANNISTQAFAGNTLRIDSSSFLYQTGTIRALVRASGTGCAILSAPHPITINPIPSTQATSNGPFCDPTNAIFEPAVVVQGANYQWTDLGGNILGLGAILTINNLSTDTTLVLSIEENGCIGFDTLVNTFSIPTIPNLIGTYTGCEGENLTFGTNTYGTNYEWVGPTGFVTYDSMITITDLSALDTGVYTLSFRDSIGCQANDIFVPIGMLATPPVPTIVGNTTICEGDTIRLTHSVSNNYLTSWIVGATAITNDTLVVLPSSSNYANSIWTLQATDSTTGCVSTKDTMIIRNGAPVALISNNGPICVGGDAVFTAPNIAGVSYEWYQGGQIIGSGNSVTVNGVTSTTGVTLDARNNAGCRGSNIDSVEVAQGAVSLIANNDTVNVVAGASSTIIDVIGNDSLGGAWTIQIIDPLNLATMNSLNNGSFDLDLTGVNSDDAFTYEVCNPSCAAACDTAVVIVNVDMLGDCMIPNIFTPNDDNVNDVFEIPCLSGLGNKLWIFNRWGDLIYETDNYQNNWGGTHNGMTVPDGTYFYILQTNSGEEKQSSIEVRR
jgi:gliding motility-associated-like protein